MNFNRPLILASNSPRRKQLLLEAGFEFIVRTKEIKEDFPDDMPLTDVARYLSEKKASAFRDELKNEVVIAADTVVICENKFLGKPANALEAATMLQWLSGKVHLVITGITLMDAHKTKSFDETTEVYFKELTQEEIDYYIKHYKPFDKAGAYGIQEWLGLIAIKKINGSYYNVVGLPVQKLYEELKRF